MSGEKRHHPMTEGYQRKADNRTDMGGAIRQIRKARGYTQVELAAKMGISRSTVSKIESGKFNLSVDYVFRFAEVLEFEIILQTGSQPFLFQK